MKLAKDLYLQGPYILVGRDIDTQLSSMSDGDEYYRRKEPLRGLGC